jgi:lysophospholipase L1-like esterase
MWVPTRMKLFNAQNRKIVLAWLCTVAGASVWSQTNHQFAFDTGQPQSGWIQVSATNFYSAEAGYGFEPGADLTGTDCLTGKTPFLFSVKVPEGNYAVSVRLNDRAGEVVTTVKAEQRRLALEKVRTDGTRTFIVNVRTPRISDTQKVHLKVPRETTEETKEWDDKLTLEFDGVNPTIRTLVVTPTNVPTVFIAGDSTVCDQPAEPWNSWGQMLPRFLKPDVAVANYAESGESVKSSLGAHRFDKIFSLMKPGDYLFVQFGHNDMKDKATNALAVYKANLEKIVARTRELGGTPVLVTSMERKAGVTQDTLAGYPQTVRDVAQAEHCALVDLNAMSREFYQALGKDLDKAFVDGTHHDNYGSYELAKCVVTGIKLAGLPLAKSITDDFGDFNPSHPDSVATFDLPASPNVSTTKPPGN